MLERIDLHVAICGNKQQTAFNVIANGIHWVICGGESGPNARLFDVDWARSIVEQCKAGGVPVFVKQLGANIMGREMDKWVTRIKDKKGGEMNEWPIELQIREFPND